MIDLKKSGNCYLKCLIAAVHLFSLHFCSSAVMKRYLGAINQKEHIRSTISTCGTFVISGSEDGTACVWNTESGKTLLTFQSSSSPSSSSPSS